MSNGELPMVFAVVPAYNRSTKTLRFIHSFSQVTYPRKRVVIVDDGSTDHTSYNVQINYPDVPVLQGNGNLWWSGGTNKGIRYALANGADYILTINDDAIMEPDFLTEMVKVAVCDAKYIVGCRIHRQDRPDVIWSIGTSLYFKGRETFRLNHAEEQWQAIGGQLLHPFPVDTMPGNGVLIPRRVFDEIGFYDEVNMPQYHADSDLMLRARNKGFKPVISLHSVIYNHILEKPLVDNRYDLVFSKKSDRYWRATWVTIWRYCPVGKKVWMFLLQYAPFFTPGWAMNCGRMFKRMIGMKA